MKLMPRGQVTASDVARAARVVRTPFYLYDEAFIVERCRALLAMPHAFGLGVSYAMKANSNRALLQLITSQGLGIDASSLNEARRARMAGVPYDRMMLTAQDVPDGEDQSDLRRMMGEGLTYNVCSLRQLELVAPIARERAIKMSMRVNPGVGSGETVTRNTGDKYSSFGVHLASLEGAVAWARESSVVIDKVHVHIGSGGDPIAWRDNVNRMLAIVEQYFPAASVLTLGGGFKEARMPDEKAANVVELGAYAQRQFSAFAERTGRRLRAEVEPGTYVMANAGYLVTRVVDKKSSGPDGFEFLVLDGGMEANTRPLLYGSRHPFYVVSKTGVLRSSEWDPQHVSDALGFRVPVGRCCESGDAQSLDAEGHIVPRRMAEPEESAISSSSAARARTARRCRPTITTPSCRRPSCCGARTSR